MNNFIKKNIKLVLVFVLGLIVSGVGAYALTVTAGQIDYDNTTSGIQATTVQGAIDKLYEKAEEATSGSDCPAGYNKEEISEYKFICTDPNAPICRRATVLHTELCNNTTSSSLYCRGAGYSSGAVITYGQLGTSGNAPTSGDAFDCDVTGNGDWERFYYVSPYYDTSTQTFDNDYYVFIYYNNTTGAVSWYNSNTNSNGPMLAKNSLPTTSQWRPDLLKTPIRNILGLTSATSSATIKLKNFSYEGSAARLLTMQELVNACPNVSTSNGSMDNCQYFYENTSFTDGSKVGYGTWLENTYSYDSAWGLMSDARRLLANSVSSYSYFGVRPVIEVPKSKIAY